MHGLDEWQSEFASALTKRDLQALPRLINPMGEPSPKRLAVYRNNVVRGLTEALKDNFPVVCRIVGEEFFEAMAREYALQNPPRSPILLEYGSDFADFVERFEPAAGLPYLADICRIERAWLDAYHAADVRLLSADDLRALGRADVLHLRLTLHPSVRLVRSRYPVFTIWSTNIEGATPVPIDLEAGGEEVLIARTGTDVEVRSLTSPAMEFVKALSDGAAIVEATEVALDIDSEFSLAGALEDLIETDIIVGFHTGSSTLSTEREPDEKR